MNKWIKQPDGTYTLTIEVHHKSAEEAEMALEFARKMNDDGAKVTVTESDGTILVNPDDHPNAGKLFK